jgi:hypothetical protein
VIWEYWEGEEALFENKATYNVEARRRALFENQATYNVEASSLATREEEERPKQTYKPHGRGHG